MQTRPPLRNWRERWHRLVRSQDVRIGRVRLIANPDLVGKDVRRLLFRGDYEFAELQLLDSVLRPDDRVMEIGAGVGAIGLTAAAVIGAERVTSFEANPKLEALIRKNYALNQLFPNLIMKAVTVGGTPVTFNVAPSMLSSSIYSQVGGHSLTVESVAINAALHEIRPTILVVDAEGAEVDLLPAADLSGVRAILVECHAKVTGEDKVQAMMAHILNAGFRVDFEMHRNVLFVRR